MVKSYFSVHWIKINNLKTLNKKLETDSKYFIHIVFIYKIMNEFYAERINLADCQ